MSDAANTTLPGGPLLGVDYGTVRVGLAVCDRDQKIAVPLRIVTRQGSAVDAGVFREVVRAEGATGIVVGLPVHLSGDEGAKAKEARAFGVWLGRVTGLPVAFFDERFSSVQAWNALKAGGLKAAQRRKQLDKVAAQVMLQAYLETKNATGRVPEVE